jgi:hypothetical protein
VRHGTTIGIVLLVGIAVLVGAGVTGLVDPVPTIVLSALGTLIAILALVFGRIGKRQARAAARVRELAAVGNRVRGVVKEALPYAGYHGGLVLHADGVLMLLRVEILRPSGRPELVTVYVIEPSEVGKARLGTEVTVVEHPDDPDLRALEGFLSNGHRA